VLLVAVKQRRGSIAFARAPAAVPAGKRQARCSNRAWTGDAALRKLLIMKAAETLDDLRIPLGNRLEKLRGDRSGQHSIRVNQQWRICFRWTAAGLEDVEIVDYH